MQPRDIIIVLIALIAISLLLENGADSLGPKATSANHTAQQVSKAAKDYLSIYYGLWALEASNPVYRNGLWEIDVNYTIESGHSSVKAYLDDSNLKVTEIFEKGAILEEPKGATPIPNKLSCSENGKLKIMLFSDPYCPFCIKYDKDVDNLLLKFNSSIDFEYHVLETSSLNLGKKFGQENVSVTSYYFICAQNQGKLPEFKDCATGKYLKHENTPLNRTELQECSQITGLAQENLSSCLNTAKNTVGLDFSLAQTYLGNRLSTPSMVIDCKYKTSPKIAETAICYYYNTTKGCS